MSRQRFSQWGCMIANDACGARDHQVSWSHFGGDHLGYLCRKREDGPVLPAKNYTNNMVCNQAIEVRQFNHRCLQCHKFEKIDFTCRPIKGDGKSRSYIIVILFYFTFKPVKLRKSTLLSSPLARLTVRLAWQAPLILDVAWTSPHPSHAFTYPILS